MKRSRLLFTTLLVPVDYLAILAAAFFAYFIRFTSLREEIPVIYVIPADEYSRVISLVALGWILIFALNGLYTIGRRRLMDEISKIIFGCAAGFVAVLIYLVFTQSLFSSRFILLGTFLLAILFVSIGRLLVRGLERAALASGFGTMNLVLIGESASRLAIRDEFKNRLNLGYRVTGEFDHLDSAATQKIKSLHKGRKVDGLMLTDPKATRDESLEITNLSEDLHIGFFYSADLFAAASSNIAVHTFAGTPVIEVKKTRLEGWGRIWKRLFDIIISSLLLVITSPIQILVAFAVALESGWPIFFKNERVGEHEKKFDTLKFRSMYQKFSIGTQFPNREQAMRYEEKLIKELSDKKGPVYKIKDDPRVTRVGRFIRRWSLDELPQLWNVLRGDMSLVGPRPHQPREVEKYARHHRHVLDVKPGITGLAQISGRSNLDFEEEVRLDTYYIENWSVKLDLFILAKTPFVVLLRRGAY